MFESAYALAVFVPLEVFLFLRLFQLLVLELVWLLALSLLLRALELE